MRPSVDGIFMTGVEQGLRSVVDVAAFDSQSERLVCIEMRAGRPDLDLRFNDLTRSHSRFVAVCEHGQVVG